MKTLVENNVKLKEEVDLSLGLCATCSNLAECTFPRNSESPIMHCDEFCGYEMKGLVLTDQDLVPKQKSRTTIPVAPSPSKYNGLCMNCDNSEGCTFPRSESGVWHCEEYK